MGLKEQLDKQIKELEETRKHILNRIKDIQANRKFKCVCGKMHAIKNCVAKKYAVRPVGYDDDWGWSDTYVVCPITGQENRMLFSTYSYDLPYEERSKHGNNLDAQFNYIYWDLFKDRVLVDDEHKSNNWWNNEYIAKNYKRFDLKIEYIDKMKQKFRNM